MNPGRIISLTLDYNVHFFDRNFMFVSSTQSKMIAFEREQVLGMHIKLFLMPSEYESARAVLEKVFTTKMPEFFAYCIPPHNYFSLIDYIETDNVVAVHEVFDDPGNRDQLKKFLMSASGNLHKQLYRKDVG